MTEYRTPQKSTSSSSSIDIDSKRDGPSTPYLAATAISPTVNVLHSSHHTHQSPVARRSPFSLLKHQDKSTTQTPERSAAQQAEAEEEERRTPDEVRRRRQREKQVEFGRSTEGYTNMVRLVEHDPLLRSGGVLPLSPPATEHGSKRSWDIQLRKWRRALHMFDYVFIDSEDDESLREACIEEQRKQWVSVAFTATPKEQRVRHTMEELLAARRSPLVPQKIPVGTELRGILRSPECYESVRSVVPQSVSSITRGTDISPLAAGIKIHIAPSSALVRRQMEQVEQQRLLANEKNLSTSASAAAKLNEATVRGGGPDNSPSPKKPQLTGVTATSKRHHKPGTEGNHNNSNNNNGHSTAATSESSSRGGGSRSNCSKRLQLASSSQSMGLSRSEGKLRPSVTLQSSASASSRPSISSYSPSPAQTLHREGGVARKNGKGSRPRLAPAPSEPLPSHAATASPPLAASLLGHHFPGAMLAGAVPSPSPAPAFAQPAYAPYAGMPPMPMMMPPTAPQGVVWPTSNPMPMMYVPGPPGHYPMCMPMGCYPVMPMAPAAHAVPPTAPHPASFCTPFPHAMPNSVESGAAAAAVAAAAAAYQEYMLRQQPPTPQPVPSGPGAAALRTRTDRRRVRNPKIMSAEPVRTTVMVGFNSATGQRHSKTRFVPTLKSPSPVHSEEEEEEEEGTEEGSDTEPSTASSGTVDSRTAPPHTLQRALFHRDVASTEEEDWSRPRRQASHPTPWGNAHAKGVTSMRDEQGMDQKEDGRRVAAAAAGALRRANSPRLDEAECRRAFLAAGVELF